MQASHPPPRTAPEVKEEKQEEKVVDTSDLNQAMQDIETLATELGAEEMTIELAEMINHDADDIKVISKKQ